MANLNRKIYIDERLCTNCGACVDSCLFGALSLDNEKAIIDYNSCTLCGACVDECPVSAIIKQDTEIEDITGDFNDYAGVMIWGEVEAHGDLSPVSLELLNIARQLADRKKVQLSITILGNGVANLAEYAIKHGADRVFIVDSTEFSDFLEERYIDAIAYIVNKYKPEIFLGGSTLSGRRLLPRLAVRLKTGLTADCTDLNIDPDTGILLQTRPAFGGNIMATIACPNYRPQMATVRHKVFTEALSDDSRSGDIIKIEIEEIKIARVAKALLKRIDESTEEEIPVTDADIIVAGGRGVGGQEGFNVLRELAAIFGGTIAASRAAVDSGWVPYHRQVGQTGRTVAPKLYIACGISGAIQHKVGMQTSNYIVAINKDKSAPIFDIADIGIVGDLFDVVPALVKELQAK
ncbi:electron transfer flavoprotein subunit alpha [bacterium]|nr:electron transfer flavoprotein subunit alpha [bacterium]